MRPVSTQIEASGQAHEDQYRIACELSSDYAYAFRIEADGTVVPEWGTGAVTEITGFTPDEVAERGHGIGLVHPEDLPIALQRMATLLSGQEDGSEFRIVTKAGEVRWLRETGRPIWDETEGRVVRIYAAAQDITERKRFEAALAASEERFRVLVEQSSDVICLLEADATIRYASPSLTRVTGYSPADVIGHTGFEFIHVEDRERIAQWFAGVLERSGVPVAAQHRVQHGDGSWHWMETVATNLLATPGIRAILSTQRDITERMRAEEALEERARLATLGAEVGVALARDEPLRSMLHGCAAAIVQNLGVALARIWTLEVEDDILELQASEGLVTHLDGRDSRVPVGQNEIGLVAAERKPHVTNDALNDVRIGDRGWVRQEGMIAFAGYPLIVDEDLVGVVALFARDKLTEFTFGALGTIAQEIAVGIQRKQAEAALLRSEVQKGALLEVAQDIAGTLDLDALIDRVQRRVAELLPCDMALTFALDAESDVLQMLSAYGVPTRLLAPLRELRFKGFEPFEGRMRRGETMVINDMAAQKWFSAELVAQFRLTALIAAPVLMRGRYFGSLVACNVTGRRFESHQVALLTAIARQLAVASDAAEQYGRQKEETEVSTALARVSGEIVAYLGTPAFLDRLCQVTAEVLECDASHTLLWRPDEDVYVPVAGYGATPEEQELARIITVPRQVMSGLLARLEHADVSQVSTIPPDLLSIAAQARLGLAATLCMALRRGTTLIGIQVTLARHRAEPFRPVHWRIAQGISRVASLALEHARVVEELNRASRLKSEFVATMSHELRTPLNIIMGYADLLLGEAFGPLTLDQAETLGQVNRSAGELFELVNTTLDLGRLDAGRDTLVIEEIALAELVSEVRAETRTIAGKAGVSVVWSIASDLPRLYTDAVKVKTILRNLLNNAVKFTECGTVTVSVVPANDGVVLEVTDTGIGIATEALPIIFEPFRQVDGSTTRQYGGVGLGLYIVRRFVDLLGGKVTVESAVARGSTFRVWFPLRGDQSGSATPRAVP